MILCLVMVRARGPARAFFVVNLTLMTSIEWLLPLVSFIATCLTVYLFTVPYRDIQTFRKEGSVGQRAFLPLVAVLNNCIVW
jgi:hypothetical protein